MRVTSTNILRLRTLALIVALSSACIAMSGCQPNKDASGQGPAEVAGKKLDQAAVVAGRELKQAAEKTGEVIEKAGVKLQEKAEEAQR